MNIKRAGTVFICVILVSGIVMSIYLKAFPRTPVYVIAELSIKDQKTYSEYASKAPDIVRKYGGQYLVRGGKVDPMAGGWDPERLIVIKFSSKEQIKKCFSSKEYLAIMPLRESSTTSRAVIVEERLRDVSEFDRRRVLEINSELS